MPEIIRKPQSDFNFDNSETVYSIVVSQLTVPCEQLVFAGFCSTCIDGERYKPKRAYTYAVTAEDWLDSIRTGAWLRNPVVFAEESVDGYGGHPVIAGYEISRLEHDGFRRWKPSDGETLVSACSQLTIWEL